MLAFDWSRFKLFTLKFSKQSVQTPSCEKPKIAQRTLSLRTEGYSIRHEGIFSFIEKINMDMQKQKKAVRFQGSLFFVFYTEEKDVLLVSKGISQSNS